MDYVGIDIGSTAAKVCALHEGKELFFLLPTGWSSRDASEKIAALLKEHGICAENKQKTRVASTGYGRAAVAYADRKITEITCHARGGAFLAGENCTVIDVGGQDTKIITVENGLVTDFLMNDKCAAGTGKFIELMANRLELSIPALFAAAKRGKPIAISALCTVFAESEVVSLIGQNKERANIAAGVVDSVATKVASLTAKRSLQETVVLTGGFSQSPYFGTVLGRKLKKDVIVPARGLYAGAIGARLMAEKTN